MKRFIAISVVSAIVVIYASSIWLSLTEAERRAVRLDIPPASADYLKIDISVVHVDLLRSDMTTRISFHLVGRLAQDEITPATDLKLVLNTIHGPQEFDFRKGQRINPIEAVFPLEGDASLYPFDHYKGVLWLFATIPGKQPTAPGPTSNASFNIIPDEIEGSIGLPVSTSALGEQVQADTKTTFSALIPGLTFRESRSILSAQTLKGLTGIEVNLRRSPNVIFISAVTMLMMAGLSIGLVFVVLSVVSGRRDVSGLQITMATSLIFGLPALRNIQPGIPPPGTFGDSIVFTWAEMAAAASGVTLMIGWLINRNSERKFPED